VRAPTACVLRERREYQRQLQRLERVATDKRKSNKPISSFRSDSSSRVRAQLNVGLQIVPTKTQAVMTHGNQNPRMQYRRKQAWLPQAQLWSPYGAQSPGGSGLGRARPHASVVGGCRVANKLGVGVRPAYTTVARNGLPDRRSITHQCVARVWLLISMSFRPRARLSTRGTLRDCSTKRALIKLSLIDQHDPPKDVQCRLLRAPLVGMPSNQRAH